MLNLGEFRNFINASLEFGARCRSDSILTNNSIWALKYSSEFLIINSAFDLLDGIIEIGGSKKIFFLFFRALGLLCLTYSPDDVKEMV